MWQHPTPELDFTSASQTLLIFDWDDTLFPTTFVRDQHGLGSRSQLKGHPQYAQISAKIKVCEDAAIKVVSEAAKLAQVVIVTLANFEWVDDMSQEFFPRMRKLLRQSGIKIVYAQNEVEHPDDLEEFTRERAVEYWSGLKGAAISQEAHTFYEDRCWQNVISVGDAVYERRGTLWAVQTYLDERPATCAEQVRTKTFKMMDLPSAPDLATQLQALLRFLPRLCFLDGSCDLELRAADDQVGLQEIEETLGSVHVPDWHAA